MPTALVSCLKILVVSVVPKRGSIDPGGPLKNFGVHGLYMHKMKAKQRNAKLRGVVV